MNDSYSVQTYQTGSDMVSRHANAFLPTYSAANFCLRSRYGGKCSRLRGRSILVVEDEPLIALDLERYLQGAGAYVLCASAHARALRLMDRPGLSAAVLDYSLTDGDCRPVSALFGLARVGFRFPTDGHSAKLKRSCLRQGALVPSDFSPSSDSLCAIEAPCLSAGG